MIPDRRTFLSAGFGVTAAVWQPVSARAAMSAAAAAARRMVVRDAEVSMMCSLWCARPPLDLALIRESQDRISVRTRAHIHRISAGRRGY